MNELYSQSEIFTKTQKLSEELEQLYVSGTFELNKRAKVIIEEMEKLQNKCKHEFDENGVCKFCKKVRND
jgi:hypothetical protein